MGDFKRSLGLNTSIAIVIGGVIGSGIFMKPALMASQLGSPILLLSVWIVAGVITLFGALSNAEVAAMFPETGGQYVFFKKMYGQGFAFLYGWACFAVINTAGNASIAYVCAQYMNYFFTLPDLSPAIEQSTGFHIPFIGAIYPLKNFGLKTLTILIVLVFTWINYKSVGYSAWIQRFLTLLKAIAIFLLITGLLFSGKGNYGNISITAPDMPTGIGLFAAYMAAIGGAFWAYDGWNGITFVAGEIKNPQRLIPRSLFIGLCFCIITYFALNLAYLYMMPIHEISRSPFIASDAAVVAWGFIGGSLIALMVIVSTLGTANANVLSTARVTFAMSRENRAFKWAGKVQSHNNTPGNALLLNSFWACLLVMSGSFDMLTDMLIFVSWFFYAMSALGVFILRKKYKTMERPYKVWGYPVVPAIFILFTMTFLVSTLVNDIRNYYNGHTILINSVLGIVITLAGIPFYYFSGKNSINKYAE